MCTKVIVWMGVVLTGVVLLSGNPPTPLRAEAEPAKVKKPPKTRAKHDPKQIAAARELRDKFLEHVNTNPNALPDSAARYHVCKQIEAPQANTILQLPHPIAA